MQTGISKQCISRHEALELKFCLWVCVLVLVGRLNRTEVGLVCPILHLSILKIHKYANLIWTEVVCMVPRKLVPEEKKRRGEAGLDHSILRGGRHLKATLTLAGYISCSRMARFTLVPTLLSTVSLFF